MSLENRLLSKVIDDNNYKIIGFPFFNNAERQAQFNEAMSRL